MNSDPKRSRRAFVCLSHSPLKNVPELQEAGKQFQTAVEEARRFLADFAPDIVVMFAPDHLNLHSQIRPPFTGVLSGRCVEEFAGPPTEEGDSMDLSGVMLVPEIKLNIAPVAPSLYAELVTRDVDLAVGENVTVDHGLGLTLMDLFDEPAEVPLVPIIVNAIGFPLFPVSRAAVVGQRIGEILADEPSRIAFVGTGGLSHDPPFPKPAPGAQPLGPEEFGEALRNAPGWVHPEWDQALLAGMERGDADTFSSLEQEELDQHGGGANEVRTWAAPWAAAGCPPASFTSYQPVIPWVTGMGVAFGVADGVA